MNHPNATPSQKAGATAYGSTLVFGHLSGAVGGALLVHGIGGGAATIGSGFAMLSDSTVQVIENAHRGMSIGQAVYNINGARAIGSYAAGAFTGGVGGKAFPFIAKAAGATFGPANLASFSTTFIASTISGGSINVTGGRIGEIVSNLLTDCDPLHINDHSYYKDLAFWGALTGGFSAYLNQFNRATNKMGELSIIRNDVNNEAWDATQKAGLRISQNDHWYWTSIKNEIFRRQKPIRANFYADSPEISIMFNSDMWKGTFDIAGRSWTDFNEQIYK